MPDIAIFNDTRPDRGHYGCTLVMENLHRHLGLERLNPVFSLPFNRDWRSQNVELPRNGSIEAIVVNGEGSMHSSGHRNRPRALVALGELARDHYGVPAFVINATLHDNDGDFYQKLANFDAVFVRDTYSKEEASMHGVECSVAPDLTLSIPHMETPLARTGIGVTDSVIPQHDRALRSFAQAGGHDFRPMVETKRVPPSISTALRPKLWGQTIRDTTKPKDERFSNAHEFVNWIRSKEVIVTGRYHTVTLCLLTKTPFMYLESNTPKIGALLKDAGIDNRRRLSSLQQLDRKTLTNEVRYRDEEHDSLGHFLAAARQDNERMFSAIAGRIATA